MMIYVDLDDVLGETSRMLLSILKRDFGKEVKYDDLSTFDLATACNLDAVEYQRFFEAAHREDELMGVNPVEGAAEVLQEWTNKGFRVAIVTGRPESTFQITAKWLSRHRFAYHSIIFVDKYNRQTTSASNTLPMSSLSSMSFCVAVEDSLHTAMYLADVLRISVALRDCPWNRAALEGSSIVRCLSWFEICEVVTRNLL